MTTEQPGAAARPGRRGPIHATMTVRQVATDYPTCRAVFRRHGEPEGRRGDFGHIEPLERFAKRQGVPLQKLLAELSEAAGVEVIAEAPANAKTHRPFVAAALAVTLSFGAGWGAWLLFEIGRGGSLNAVSASQIVAHGEAQLWGFVATFIVGVAASFLPRTAAHPHPPRWLTGTLLGLLLGGVMGGFGWALAPATVPWLGAASGAALLAAALAYLALVVQQLSAKRNSPWAWFVMSSALWMVLWAIVTLVLRARAGPLGPGAYTTPERRLLLEMALFGFALNSVYGFGQKLLPGMLGGGSFRPRAVETTFACHNVGVVALAFSQLLGPGIFTALGALAIVAGGASWAVGLRGFRRTKKLNPRPEAGPPFLTRYIQLAFTWLLIGLAMLAGGESFAYARGASLPHAYLGATRHALTVGFLTTLILGVGQRLLPILSHNLLAWPALVVPTFALIATGDALRVVLELGTIAWPWCFLVMPFTALLELTALALFTANVLRTLWPAADDLVRTGRATRTTRVAVLLAEKPWIEDHLVDWDFAYIGRVRSVPNELTVSSLAIGEGFDPDETVAQINRLLETREAGQDVVVEPPSRDPSRGGAPAPKAAPASKSASDAPA